CAFAGKIRHPRNGFRGVAVLYSVDQTSDSSARGDNARGPGRLDVSEDRWLTTTAHSALMQTRVTTLRTSRFWRGSRPSASARACISARPDPAGFITLSTKL